MAADGSVIIDIEGNSKPFEKAVGSTKDSAKKAAMKLAAEYRKQGMSASDAMKKAWDEIGRTTGDGVNDTKAKLSGLSASFASVASSATRIVAAGAAAATAAVGALAKSSLDSYAAYEQLVGGVETLFKDSAGLVQQYAASAYKTAGVSANTYMEQATAFSASLVQSLGGDTKAAAEYANQAIMDMSDNANKMGTDIESLQATYQSLMRGNYAMLDNLKLGYGGTKEELKRLVADAEKLTGQALDPSKFSDIITAIHAVQENLGITGTTAKEASTTIEGSVNAMKAAWSNLTTGIADDNADLSGLIDNFVEAAKAAANNVLPRLEAFGNAVVVNLPLIGQSFMQVVQMVGTAITNGAPQLTTAALTLMQNLATAISTNLPALIPAALSMLTTISANLRANVGQLVDGAIGIVRSIGEGIIQGLPALIESVPQIITNIAGIINDNAPKLLLTAVELIAKFAMGLVKAIPTVIQNIPKIIEAIVSTLLAFNWLNLGRTIITMLKNGITAMVGAVKGAAGNILNSINGTLSSLPSKLMGLGKQGIQGLINGAKSLLGSMRGAMTTIANAVVNGVKALPGKLLNIGKQIIQGLINGIKSGISGVVTAIGNTVSSAVNTAKEKLGIHSPSRVFRDQIGLMIARGMALGIKKGEREVLSVAYRLNDKLLDAEQELNDKLSAMEQEERDRRAAVELADHQRKIKEKYAELGKAEKSERQKIQDEIAKLEADWNEKQIQAQYDAEKEKLQAQIDTMKKFRDEYEKALDEIQDAQNDMAGKLADYGELFKSVEKNGREFFELGDLQKDIDAINRYGDALENLKARGVSDSLLDEITSMGVEEATAYTERLLGMTDEQYAKYMALWEQKQAAAKQVASQFYRDEMDALGKEFVDKIPEELGEVKDEMRDIGVMGIQGMIDGMYSKSGALWNAAASIVSQAIAAMRRAADIHSPSRKTAELVGVPFAQGVGVGFEKAYPGVMERMRTAFDASMAQTSAQLQSAAGGHGSSVTREVNNNTTTVDRILRIEVTGEDGEFVRWLRNKIKTEDDRVGPALA